MKAMPYSEVKKGSFLIATPEIEEGIFYQSVLLLCEHNNNGSFGIVINKKLELEIPEELINMEQLANPHLGIRAGGPVQTNQMMLLHNSLSLREEALELCDEVLLGGDLKFLQTAMQNNEGPKLLLCFGYAGWSPGQLDREVLDGSWLIYPANSELVFDIEANKLWQHCLRKMGGRFASLSMMPADLSLN